MVAFAVFLTGRSGPAAATNWCSDTCRPLADCETECLVESDPALQTTCGEFHGGASSFWCAEGWCGDDICDGVRDETCGNCPDDCAECPDPPTCGSFGCEPGEKCLDCPQDCGTCPNPHVHNDGHCSEDEEPSSNDCRELGYCTSNAQCNERWHGNPDGYSCVEHVCLPNDLPDYAVTCQTTVLDCPTGSICEIHPAFGELIWDDFWEAYLWWNQRICLPRLSSGA
jgi:hypothetical protein